MLEADLEKTEGGERSCYKAPVIILVVFLWRWSILGHFDTISIVGGPGELTCCNQLYLMFD